MNCEFCDQLDPGDVVRDTTVKVKSGGVAVGGFTGPVHFGANGKPIHDARAGRPVEADPDGTYWVEAPPVPPELREEAL